MFLTKFSFAQQLDTLTKATIETQAKSDDAAYDFSETVGTHFADISYMAKGIDASTDKYTGAVNIEIPIYEIQTSAGKIPINLTYRTTGIRVEDIASEVGLGWELSAGGRITRSKRGQADKKEDLLYADLYAEEDGQKYYDRCLREEWDTQPDIYYFTYPGGAGSFVYDLEWKPRTIPYQNIKIDSQDDVFTIYDANGTKYVFGTKETKQESDKKYTSTWFLDRIEFVSGTCVTYEYETGSDYVVWNWNGITEFVIGSFNNKPLCTLKISNDYHSKYSILSPKYLRSVKCKEQEIKFVYDTQRDDLEGLKRLTQIDVHADKKKYRSYKLDYGTFPDKTPKLLSVNEQPQIGIIRPLCSFDYYEEVYLPSREKGYKGFDHWGFFNTNIDSPLSYPQMDIVIPNLQETDKKGASRNPVLQFTRAQSLKSIKYPNGGTKEFVYELHQGVNRKTKKYESAGGLRIKEIVERADNMAVPNVTRYKYIDGVIYDDAFNYISEYCKTGSYSGEIKVSAKSISSPVDFYGSSVVYSAVEEYLPNGSYIRYEYVPLDQFPDQEPEFIFLKDNPDKILDIKGRSPKTSRAWGRNILKSKEWFSTERLEKKETYEYLIDTAKAIKVPSRYLYADKSFSKGYGTTFYCFYDKSYLISCPVVPIKNVVARSARTLPTQTSYIYDERYAPVLVLKTDCEQNRITTYIQYPDSNSNNLCHKKLIERNAFVPIEKVTYKNGKVIDAEINFYKINPLNSAFIVPDKKLIYRYKQLIDSVDLRVSSVVNGVLDYDRTKYRTALVYDEYDDDGDLLCYHEPNGIYHSTIYNTLQSAPIAYVENARHSVRTDGRVTQVFFNDFETSGVEYATAKSGNKVGNTMSSYVIDLSYFKTGTYVLSYWYKSSETSRWRLHRQEMDVTSLSTIYHVPIISEALYIDDMSLLPKNAVMTSECAIAPLGKISETDAQGRTTYYEYNKVGLPARVYDNDRTLIQENSYDNYGVDL